MMERLANKVAEIARERVGALTAGLEQAARDELPGATVTAEQGQVTIQGKGAIRQLLIEAALQGLILYLRSLKR